jgi:hypothetical protein
MHAVRGRSVFDERLGEAWVFRTEAGCAETSAAGFPVVAPSGAALPASAPVASR